MEEEKWEKLKKEIEPRIDKLAEEGFVFETMLFFSVILEEELKYLIEIYETVLNATAIAMGLCFEPDNLRNRNLESMTLGALIRMMCAYVDDDDTIVQLQEFNKSRIRSIHKVFDENIVKLEQDVKIIKNDFYKLMEKLVDLEIEALRSRITA